MAGRWTNGYFTVNQGLAYVLITACQWLDWQQPPDGADLLVQGCFNNCHFHICPFSFIFTLHILIFLFHLLRKKVNFNLFFHRKIAFWEITKEFNGRELLCGRTPNFYSYSLPGPLNMRQCVWTQPRTTDQTRPVASVLCQCLLKYISQVNSGSDRINIWQFLLLHPRPSLTSDSTQDTSDITGGVSNGSLSNIF